MSGPNELSPKPATTQDVWSELIESRYHEYLISENSANAICQARKVVSV